jgi:hypothetical protein
MGCHAILQNSGLVVKCETRVNAPMEAAGKILKNNPMQRPGMRSDSTSS